MKPHKHAKNSAKKFGGVPEDYQAIHDFFDSSKSCMADMRHRAVLHSLEDILESTFGPDAEITASADGIRVDEYYCDY